MFVTLLKIPTFPTQTTELQGKQKPTEILRKNTPNIETKRSANQSLHTDSVHMKAITRQVKCVEILHFFPLEPKHIYIMLDEQ